VSTSRGTSATGPGQTQLAAAVEAVLQRDGDKASQVILGDKAIDQLELDVEETVIRLLNEGLATEIVCVLRYKLHHFMAKGIHSQAVAAEFLEHANEEQGHADLVAARIVQLQGELCLADVSVSTWPGFQATPEFYDEIACMLLELMAEQPEAVEVLPGCTFARTFH